MKKALFLILFVLAGNIIRLHAATPWLHVDGNKIKDPAGNVVVLRGVDIQDIAGQATDPTVGLYGLINRLTDTTDNASTSPGWYTKVIRFTINPGISNFDTYFNTILKPAVDSATKKGLYVIIDNHFIADITGNINYTNNFWTYMAPRFRNYSNVLYEVYNEPINSSMTWGQFKPYMQSWVNLIRTYAPNNLILAGSPQWDQKMGEVATNPLLGTNIVYVAHVYPAHWANAWNVSQVEAAAAVVPIFMSEWGFRQGVADTQLQGTVSGYGTGIMTWAENLGLSWSAWCADNDWEPTMFTTNWQLRVGNSEMGGFVKDLLYQKRNDRQPANIACLAPFLGQSQTLCAKSSVDIATNFTNTGKTFTWYKDGTVITGAHDSTLTVSQAGNYKVDVDSNGCTMSHQVAIINTIFQISLPADKVLLDSIQLQAGDSLSPYTYVWQKNGVLIPGASSPFLKVFDTCKTVFSVTASYPGCGSSTDNFKALCKRELFLGVPLTVPGIIQTEYFDVENVANLTYHDSDVGNNGGAFRSGDVDVENCLDAGGGYDVGWTAAGEWLEYTIKVQDPGLCGIAFRIASQATGASGGSLYITLNGVNVTNTVNIPVTGGWQTWADVVVNNINFSATDTLLRINISQAGFNINYLDIQKGLITSINQEQSNNTPAFNVYPNPTNNNVSFSGPEGTYSWQVYSPLGNLLLQGTETKADISKFPAGQYVITINGEAHKVIKW